MLRPRPQRLGRQEDDSEEEARERDNNGNPDNDEQHGAGRQPALGGPVIAGVVSHVRCLSCDAPRVTGVRLYAGPGGHNLSTGRLCET